MDLVAFPTEAQEEIGAFEHLRDGLGALTEALTADSRLTPETRTRCIALLKSADKRVGVAIKRAHAAMFAWMQDGEGRATMLVAVFEPGRIAHAAFGAVWDMLGKPT
jgi:hypothetical protein